MTDSVRDGNEIQTRSYDAVIVGGSLAGCATATMLGRAGARVAVVEKSPDPTNYKRICSHFVQASAVPTLERLGLLEQMEAAGALRPTFNMRVRWGWISPPAEGASRGVNLRREKLDPMVREMAAAVPGVDLILGQTVTALRRDGGRITGFVARDRDGVETIFEAPLTVGADGRDSLIAKLSGVKVKTYPHGRLAYGGYFEGVDLRRAPDASVWMMDPDWAAAFPTDEGLTFCAVMPTKDRLAEFRRDPQAAVVEYFDTLPEAPSLRTAKLTDEGMAGKIDMTNRMRVPSAPGLALIGDAALATDPLFGVGCGWAFQSAEWLADAVAPALVGEGDLEAGLRRYRRSHSRHLRGHAWMIHDYATGRSMQPPERLLFSAAARDQRVAKVFDEFGTRRIGPARMMATAVPLALVANARYAIRHRGRVGAPAAATGSAGTSVGAGVARPDGRASSAVRDAAGGAPEESAAAEPKHEKVGAGTGAR